MRYSILGFNQEQLVEYGLNMNETLLLDYIYNAVASPTLEHRLEENKIYVWLNHSKILEDLPILNISEDRIKRLLKHLKESELIDTIKESLGKGRGSKTFYTITEKCEQLRFTRVENNTSIENTSVKNNTSKAVRSVENNTSDNKLINNNKLITTKVVEQPKQSLYSKCVNLIDDYTQDESLRSMLTLFLKNCLDNARESGRPFYTNHFKGKLNQLSKLSDSESIRSKIVQQTLDNGWNGFYELKNNKRDVHSRLNESGAGNVPRYDKNKVKEAIERGDAEKF